MSGCKPKPTALKLLQCNPGKRRLNCNEPQAPTDVPHCPRHLTAEAKAEWRRIAPVLASMRVLRADDRAALAAYCQHWARWVQAEQAIAEMGGALIVKTPSGCPIQNSYVGIANTAMDAMRKFLSEFGLTPSSRSRIVVDRGPDSNQDDQAYFG